MVLRMPLSASRLLVKPRAICFFLSASSGETADILVDEAAGFWTNSQRLSRCQAMPPVRISTPDPQSWSYIWTSLVRQTFEFSSKFHAFGDYSWEQHASWWLVGKVFPAR